jgi:hypothetical protein
MFMGAHASLLYGIYIIIICKFHFFTMHFTRHDIDNED